MNGETKRSPLFYVGDKYRLLGQILELFPEKIETFYEPFVGGGSVFLNIDAKRYLLNDIDGHLINIHKFLISNAKTPDVFFKDAEKITRKYGLSFSCKRDVVPDALKKEFKKTYYAKFNKEGYEKLRRYVNKNEKNDPLILYILLIYGFNRMLRFNGGGKFNLPVGNVDFNKNVAKALNGYFDFVCEKKMKFTAKDFRKFLDGGKYAENDFVYLDPPYLIAASEYNKIWGEKEDVDLLGLIDALNEKGVKFALSNVTHYNGGRNGLLVKWMKKYKTHNIRSNYISYHDNTKKEIKEILITNY